MYRRLCKLQMKSSKFVHLFLNPRRMDLQKKSRSLGNVEVPPRGVLKLVAGTPILYLPVGLEEGTFEYLISSILISRHAINSHFSEDF